MSLYFNAKEQGDAPGAGSKPRYGGKIGPGKAKVKIRQMEVMGLITCVVCMYVCVFGGGYGDA